MSRLLRQIKLNTSCNVKCIFLHKQQISINKFCSLSQANLKIQEILSDGSEITKVDDEVKMSDDNNLTIYKKIEYASSFEEIIKLLNEYEKTFPNLRLSKYCDPLIYPTMFKLYPEAIRKCGLLNLENEGWKLFDLCKEKNYLSSYLYSIMMWFTMKFDPTNSGLNKSFDLFHEMLNETTLIPTAMIDAQLIENCIITKQFDKGFDVLNKIKHNKNANILLSSQTLLISIAKLFVESNNIDQGLKFLFNIYKTFKIIPNSKQCHILLTGIAKRINITQQDLEKRKEYLLYSQKLLDFSITKNKGIYQHTPINVYTSFLNVFSKLGDYKTCLDILNFIIDNNLKTNIVCFTTALSSIIHSNNNNINTNIDIDIQHQNEIINQIINKMMEISTIKTNWIYYSVLMNIASQHGDIDKISMYFEQFINDKNCNDKCTEINVENMSEYSIKCFQKIKLQSNNDENDKISQFKSWLIDQYKKYNSLPLVEKDKDIERFTQLIHDSL